MAYRFRGMVTWCTLLIAVFELSICQTGWSDDSEDLVSTAQVEAVVGKVASLPCNIEPDSNEDRVYMVLWFRHAGGKPLYSFDVRGRSFNKALHWSDPLAFGPRAHFRTIAKPSSLTIDAVQLDDEGMYRCRVDFKNSPTRNFQIRLNVVVPPHQVLLYDEAGKDVAGVVGPLEEGENFTLLCELRGGRPQPTLKWLINKTPLEDHVILKNDGKVIISKITVTGAERSWQNNNIRCQATNTRLLSPHERSARIEMRLRPTSVKIINKPDRLLAEGEMVLICVIQGSRPPVDVTWFRENRQYTRGRHSETSNDTTTISKMVMRPQPDDDGAIIRCRAENRALNFGLEDFFRMTVIYKPVITLTLGSTLNPDDIKEGDDVYFECNIKANPKEYRISWYHNDELVTQNLSSGVFISTKSLVLQKVRKQNRGLYTCKAANLLGESSSLTVYLRVQFSPICAQPSPFLLGARIDEPLRVRCQVDADPSEVTFYWQFNNSGESFQVSPARYTIVDQPNKGSDNVDGLKSDDYTVAFASGGTVSELRYRAASDRDYGALHCRAGNSVGHQIKPCVIQLVPAARPTPPRNCSWHKVFKNEEKYLTVQCYAGYDGGLSQHFTIELLGKHARVLLNTSSRYQDYAARSMADLVVWLNMSWSVLDSLPDNAVVAVVARNIKGPSEPVILTNLIFRDPKPEETTYADLKFPIAVAMSILAAAIAASAVIVAIIVRRRNNQASGSKRPSQSVVQVDAQGRNFVIAYPPPPAAKEDKPDILIPKPEERPRVVFETTSGSGRTSFFFKKTNRDGPPDENKENGQSSKNYYVCKNCNRRHRHCRCFVPPPPLRLVDIKRVMCRKWGPEPAPRRRK